jgi:hypothetical protein
MSEEYEPAPLPALPEERRRRPGESLDEYIDRLWPEARRAIAEVDRTLFEVTLSMTPIERLERATRAAWELEALRRSVRARR